VDENAIRTVVGDGEELAGLEIEGEELDLLIGRVFADGGPAVEDHALRIDDAARDGVLGDGMGDDDLGFTGLGMRAQDPFALVAVAVVRDRRRAPIGGVVKPAVAPEIDAALHLAWAIVHAGREGEDGFEELRGVDEVGELLELAVVGPQVRGPFRGEVIVIRRVIDIAGDEAIGAMRPRVAGIVLLRIESEVDDGGALRNGDALAQVRARLKEGRRGLGDDCLAVRQCRRVWQRVARVGRFRLLSVGGGEKGRDGKQQEAELVHGGRVTAIGTRCAGG
jgi:hypothetical protein